MISRMSDADENAAEAKTSVENADDAEIAAMVEAILFSSDSPLTVNKIAQVAELAGTRSVRQAIETLNARYEQMACAFHIEAVAGGYQMLTRPEYHDVLSRLLRARSQTRLTHASLETLAIVAYRQPILRADIEAIRGVGCGEVLRGLMEKQLVKIVGRAEVLGRPMLYGTTRRFLEVFGLSSLDDLPRVEELRSGASAGNRKKAPAENETQGGPQAEPSEEDSSKPQEDATASEDGVSEEA